MEHAVSAGAGGAQAEVVTSGVDRQDGQRPGGAPPQPRPRITGIVEVSVPECGEYRLGDEVPQPAEDIEDDLAIPFLVLERLPGGSGTCLRGAIAVA